MHESEYESEFRKKSTSPSASSNPQIIKFAFLKKNLNVKSTIRDLSSL